MNQTVVTLVILGLYAVVLVVLGLYSRARAGTLTAFVVGGRNVGSVLSAFSYGTAYFSAVVFVGYAGKNGWDFGLWAALIGIGNALIGTFLSWKILGERTREVTSRLNIKTLPEFFEKRYGSRNMKTVAALIIFVFLLPYSASVYSGLGYMCEAVLGIDFGLCMLFIAAVTALYVVLGGYGGAVLADMFQGIVMVGVLIAMVVNLTSAPEFGGLLESLRVTGAETAASVNLLDFSGPGNVINLVLMILLTSLGTWGMPQTLQKFFGMKKGAVKRGTIISTLFALFVSGGAYTIGSFVRVLVKNPPMSGGAVQYDLLVPHMLESRLAPIVLSFVLVLLAAASMSTLSSLTLTAASSIAIDLVRDRIRPDLDEKRTLALTRVFCLLFVAASYAIARTQSPIMLLMGFSWGTVAGAFLGPFLLGLFWKGATRTGAFAGMLAGAGFSVVAAVASGLQTVYSAPIGVVAMGVGIFVTGFVSRMTKRELSSVPLPADERGGVVPPTKSVSL